MPSSKWWAAARLPRRSEGENLGWARKGEGLLRPCVQVVELGTNAALVAAAIPVAGLVWQMWAARWERAAREVNALDAAIDAAHKRDDPIEHAYRAMAYERLTLAHQRDGASRGLAWLLAWGVYALLVSIATLTSLDSIDDTTIYIWLAAIALSTIRAAWGLRLYIHGMATYDPLSAERYRQMVAYERLMFVALTEHAEKMPIPGGLPKFFLGRQDKKPEQKPTK